MKVSVILPTLEAADHLPRLLEGLAGQSRPPEEILVVDSSSADGTADIAREAGCRVIVIPRVDFGHGRTRNLATAEAVGDILVFLTQDALPGHDGFLETLVRPVEDGRAAAAYARQEPRPTARPTERAARRINYPAAGHLRTIDDLPRMGIRAYFFSNVASAIRRVDLDAVGGFPGATITNEDMFLCARLLHAGRTVCYQAEARVIHSHDLGLSGLFARYFDIGVFFDQAGSEIGSVPGRGEGWRFVRDQWAWLAENGMRWSIPRALAEAAARWLGYRSGRVHRRLPRSVRRRLGLNRNHWVDRTGEGVREPSAEASP